MCGEAASLMYILLLILLLCYNLLYCCYCAFPIPLLLSFSKLLSQPIACVFVPLLPKEVGGRGVAYLEFNFRLVLIHHNPLFETEPKFHLALRGIL